MNVTWQHFDQSAEQLIVCYTTNENHALIKKLQICNQWCDEHMCHCMFYTVSNSVLTYCTETCHQRLLTALAEYFPPWLFVCDMSVCLSVCHSRSYTITPVLCVCVCLSVCHSQSYTITPVQCCLQLLIQCRCRIASSTLRLFWQISQTHWVHRAERLLAGVCMSFTCLTVALDTTSCSLHCSI